MTKGIVLALAAAVIYGFLGVSLEVVGKRHYAIWVYNFYKMLIGFLLGLGCAIVLRLPLYAPKMMWLGLVGAATFPLTAAAYLTAARERDIAANWTILNLSVVLPIVFSVWWFGDKFTSGKAVGVIFTAGAIILIGEGFRGISLRMLKGTWVGWIALAFLLNGWLVAMFRFVPPTMGPVFTLYFYGFSVLLVIPILLWTGDSWQPSGAVLGLAAVSAVSHWSGIMLTIIALATVAKVSHQAGLIVYPITNGLVIPAGVIFGIAILKQKISLTTGAGVVCGIVALAILSLS